MLTKVKTMDLDVLIGCGIYSTSESPLRRRRICRLVQGRRKSIQQSLLNSRSHRRRRPRGHWSAGIVTMTHPPALAARRRASSILGTVGRWHNEGITIRSCCRFKTDTRQPRMAMNSVPHPNKVRRNLVDDLFVQASCCQASSCGPSETGKSKVNDRNTAHVSRREPPAPTPAAASHNDYMTARKTAELR